MFEKCDKVEVIFIGIYFLEQISLILLYILSPKLLPFWIGAFPVVFLTTIAFEKVFMKIEFKEREKNLLNQLNEKDSEVKKYREVKDVRDSLNKLFHRNRI